MAITHCLKCWNTPCTCGYDYLDYSLDSLNRNIKMLQTVKNFKISNPHLIHGKNGLGIGVSDEYWKKYLAFKEITEL